MKRALMLCSAALLVSAVGCSKKDHSAASTTSSATAAASAAPADSAIPTEEDFEEQAAQKVTAQNMDSQLDQLDKEINK